MSDDEKFGVKDVSIHGGDYGLRAFRPVIADGLKIEGSDVGVHLGSSASGSIVQNSLFTGGRVGIQIGGDPDLERQLDRVRAQFPVLNGAQTADIVDAVRLLQCAHDQNRTESLRFSGLGRFLAEGGFVGWANLANGLLQWWSK